MTSIINYKQFLENRELLQTNKTDVSRITMAENTAQARIFPVPKKRPDSTSYFTRKAMHSLQKRASQDFGLLAD